jgi:mannonate dehydratase
MKTNRRHFARVAASGALATVLPSVKGAEPHFSTLMNSSRQGGLLAPKGIKIGNTIAPSATESEIATYRQCGVECASVWTTVDNANYDYFKRMRDLYAAHEIQVYNIGILDLHCDPTIVLQLPGYREKIEQCKAYVTALGKAGIHYTTYAHMANIKMRPYYMTGTTSARGGASTRLFDLDAAEKLPLSHGRIYGEDEIWKSFTDFIQAVMPSAEKAGVRIGLHPDDPPVPSLGGVARVFRNFEGYERALEIANSDNFGLCLCVGTWSEGGPRMGKNVVEMIRYFGPKGKIFKIHFRNVDTYLPRFHETFVDERYVDMYKVMRALGEVKFDGIVIPDHVPAGANPGMNTAFTIGYMKALRDRVNAELLEIT